MTEKPTRTHPELTEQQEATLHTFRQELLDEGIIAAEGDSLGTQYDWVLLSVVFFNAYSPGQSAN